MKKGFHNFSNLNNDQSNSQSINSNHQNGFKLNPNHNSFNNLNNFNQNSSQNLQKKQPSGFSSCATNPPLATSDQNRQTLNFPVNQNSFSANNSPFNRQTESNDQTYNIFSQQNKNPYSGLLSRFGNNIRQICEDQTNSEAMIMALFQIIQTQAKSLQRLFEKVETMTLKINEFNQKMLEIKKNKNQVISINQKPQSSLSLSHNVQNIDSGSLIKILFGANKAYDFKLQLVKNMDEQLYRQRNFEIQLRLVNSEGKIVDNHNKIPLSLALYSSQNPPKFIQKNTTGQKILKGYVEQSLQHGFCRFQKIQIREVTSHFRNGWIFIVVIPCMTPLGSANPNRKFIDYVKIQPLVLQKIVVKAKKINKNKDKGAKKQKQSKLQDKEDSELIQNRSSFINGGSKQQEMQQESVDKEEAQKIQENSQEIYDQK